MTENTTDIALKHLTACIVGPDCPGLLARVARIARESDVDLTESLAGVQRGRAMIFCTCEGGDAQLNAFCDSIQRSFPAPTNEPGVELAPDALLGYSVDIDDPSDPEGQRWSQTELLLDILAENRKGFLEGVTDLLGHEGFNVAYHRARRFPVPVPTNLRYSRHRFGIRPPLAYFDKEAFRRKLQAYQRDHLFDRCELRDPMDNLC